MVKITENNTGISRQNQTAKSKSVNKKTASKSLEKSQTAQKSAPVSQDTVQISSAQQLTKTDENFDVQKYQNLLQKFSKNQLKDLNDYAEKEKSGFYEQEEVIEKTSDTILNHPGFYKSVSTDKLPVSDNLIRIRNNIKNGYYDSDDVLDKISEKLIYSGITPLER